MYTDCYRNYNALDVNDFYYERIINSKLYGRGKNQTNDIEIFWNQSNVCWENTSGFK